MRFLRPELLWLLLAVPFLILGSVVAARAARRALERFAGGATYAGRFTGEVSVHRRVAKTMLLTFALVAAIFAAARPQWGTRLESVSRRGIDVVIVVDHSLSMAADDLQPSRLRHATHSVDSLLRELEGNRAALVAFAGLPVVLCPLTLDHAAVRLFLNVVEPEVTQVPGTALAEALRLALRSFGGSSDAERDRSRAIVLLTDGEDHEGELDEVIEEIREAGVPVYAIGCGTTSGSPIPLRSPDDPRGAVRGYKKDPEGKVVTTRLDEDLLERLALETGGRYYRASSAENEIGEISRALTSLDAREYGAVLRARYEERFQVPLALAVLALLGELLLGDRRKIRRPEAG